MAINFEKMLASLISNWSLLPTSQNSFAEKVSSTQNFLATPLIRDKIENILSINGQQSDISRI
jgi:hypothetical protein